MKYVVAFYAEVAEADIDIIPIIPDVIQNRFEGSAVHVSNISVRVSPE